MAEATLGIEECDRALQFFETLYGGYGDGWLVTSKLIRPELPKDPFVVVVGQWRVKDEHALELAAAEVVKQSLMGFDSYFGIALMRTKIPTGRGKAEDALLVPGVWAEVDFGTDGHSSTELLSELDALNVIQSKRVWEPSLIVRSGGGFHLYWLLDEPYRVDTPEGAAAVRRANRGVGQMLLNAGIPRIDPTDNLAQVFRPPGTKNFKLLDRPRDVAIVHAPGHRFPWGYLSSEIFKLVAEEPVRPVGVGWDGGGDVVLVPLNGIVEGCAWMRHARDDAAALPEPEWRAMLSVLGRVEGGREIAHEWSAPHSGYSVAATDEKMVGAERPFMCATIEKDAGPSWCAGCAIQGAGKSPISLSRHLTLLPSVVSGGDGGDERGGTATAETDLKNAHRLEAAYGQDAFAVGREWWTWDGRRWQADEQNWAERKSTFLSEIIRAEISALALSGGMQEKIDALGKMLKRVEQTAGMGAARQAWQWITTQHSMNDLDANGGVLNVLNGVLDLETGVLTPADRSALQTRLAGCEWHGADVECPAWEAFVAQIIPDPEGRKCLQQLAGLSLTNRTDPRVMPILLGGGTNGKTAWVENFMRVLGEYATPAPEDFVVGRKESPHPTSLAALKGARMVSTSETGPSAELDATFLKKITGGGRVKAHFMHKDEFEYVPEFTIWMDTNHQPRVRDATDAIWGRLVLIPFSVRIPDEDVVDRVQLDARFDAELPGILAWAVRGYWSLRSVGFKLEVPLEWRFARDRYRAEEDIFGEFLGECCVMEEGSRVVFKDLMGVYKVWCEARNERGWSSTAVGRELTNRGFGGCRVGNGAGREGLMVRDEKKLNAFGLQV